MCGTATLFAHFTWGAWHCHVSRAFHMGRVALPRFSRSARRMRGTATFLAHFTWDAWHCHVSRVIGIARAARVKGPLPLSHPFAHEIDDLLLRVDAELRVDIARMVVDCTRGNEQRLLDVLRGIALRQQLQHIDFAL